MARNYDPESIKEVGKSQKNFWSPPEGESVIRLLPPAVELPKRMPYRMVIFHGSDPSNQLICRKSIDIYEECPICSWANTNKDEYKDIIQQLRPRVRYFMDIVVRGEEPNVYIWGFGKTVVAQLNAYLADEDYVIKENGEEFDIMDINKGRDFKLLRVGTGMLTNYQLNPKPSISPLHSDPKILNEILNSRHDLNAIYRIPTSEELLEKFYSWLQAEKDAQILDI